MTRALALTFAATALAFSACSGFEREPPPCVSNSDCPSGNLCFAEGCGDPGKGIVVEVVGAAMSNHKAHDFKLDDGTLGATQNFSLGAPLMISGQLQRELSAGNPADRTAYTDGVVVRAVGTSNLLPGVARTFETRFDKPEFGYYEMNLGAGTFTVTATPANPNVPPVSSSASVSSGAAAPSVSFAFPAIDGTPALTGQLVKKLDAQLEPILISAGFDGGAVPVVDLQLFDPSTEQPLSQRFPVGTVSGEFAIPVSPDARMKPRLVFVASPREPGAAVPTKRFVLDNPLPTALSLEYGDYGESAELVGRVVDERSVPVVGAHVVIEGTVVGEGIFRSKIVQTDAEGEFKVRTLGSKSEGAFQITVVPPETSQAAYLRKAITVTVTLDQNEQKWVANMKPSAIVLADRLRVKGRVATATDADRGMPNVAVRATLQVDRANSSTTSLPVDPAETITDASGDFELRLDPGVWRFEYRAGGQVPLTTRLVEIVAKRDDQGNEIDELSLSPVQLSNGRTVSGTVTGLKGNQLEAGLGFASLRFFRVTPISGKQVSVLLGEAISDEAGKYTVVLPTVMTPSNSGGQPATP